MIDSIAARIRARSACFFLAGTLSRTSRIFSLIGLALAAMIVPLSAFATGSTTVVISQVYGGGGNSGATIKNDFIELFNSSSAPVSLAGMSVQYASSTGTSWQVTSLTNVTLQPGQFYLVQEAAGTGGTALANSDVTGSINLSGTTGKVALVNSTTALTVACPASTAVVDFVGFGTANCSEPVDAFSATNNAPTLTNTTAALRNNISNNTCTDTNNNKADFIAATPNPRYTGTTPFTPCSGTPPSGTGNANPNSLSIGDSTLLTVAVVRGSAGSAINSVTVNLSAFGGSAAQPLYDDGTQGDVTSGDGTYSFNFTVPAGTAGGPYTLNATITDAANNTATATISLTINAPTAIVATGAANPATLGIGDQTLLTVAVTPGANPTSTSLMVVADLSAIGGSSTQMLYDDGSNGDVTSGDGTYSFLATIGGSPSGTISIPVTVSDAQLRSTPTTIALTIVPELSIMDIQGHGGRSAYAGTGSTLGTTLIKTPSAGHTNIVTALKISGTSNGFFMQDSGPHTDLTASSGIFVFTGATVPTVAIGDSVVVTGKVQEFSGSTEIAGSPTVTKVGTGTVPAAYDLTANLPSTDPTQGICMGAGSTIVVPTTTAENDGYQASNFACLDGMLVQMSNGVVVAPTSGSGGDGVHVDSATFFYASAGNPRPFREPGLAPGDTHKTASYTGPLYDGDPEIVEIYYPGLKLTTSTLPDAGSGPGIYNAGQHFNLTGIIQGFLPSSGCAPNCALTYEMYPRTGSDLTLVGSAPTYPIPVADAAAGRLTIGSQNGLHFFNSTYDGGNDTSQYTDTCGGVSNTNGSLGTGADDTCPTLAEYQNRLKKMSLQIRTVLKAPLVQVMQEVENRNVAVDLANQINTDDASITYHPYLIAGNDPGGINIAILVRDGVTVNSVSQLAKPTITNACSSPGTCLQNDRPPVLLDAVYNGYHFRVLAIYDRSLLNLGVNDYVGLKRRQEAEQVSRIVQVLQTDGATLSGNDVCDAQQDSLGNLDTACSLPITGDSTVPFVVLGDFNAYEFSDGYVDVVGTIMGTVDTTASDSVYPPTAVADAYDPVYVAPSPQLFNSTSPTLDKTANPDNWNDNYSYTFDGYAQEIDHILMSSVANKDFVHISHAHGDADVSSSSPDVLSATTARRTSDHDGQVIQLGFVVTSSAGANGSISPSAAQTVSSTTPLVFTLSAASGYSASVTDTCGSGGSSAGSFDAGTNTYTIPAGVSADCSVNATFAINSYTLTYTAGPNGSVDGNPSESQTVNYGQAGTPVNALPSTGYHFVNWSDASTDNPRTDMNVTANINVTANFAINTYQVTPSAGPNGSITPNSVQTVNYLGTTVFTAVADSGYSIAGVSGCGATLSGSTITTGAITADCTVGVTFSANPVSGACGSDNGQILLATPTNLCSAGVASLVSGSGHPWNWSCAGSNGGSNASCSATIKTWTVAASAGKGGSVSPASQTVDNGSSASVVVTASTGYAISSVSGCGGSLSGTSYTTGAITANCAITAVFIVSKPVNGKCGSDDGKALTYMPTNLCNAGVPSVVSGDGHPWSWSCAGTSGGTTASCSATIKTWQVNANANTGGSITPASQAVDNGQTTSLTVTADTGYTLTGVSGCGGSLTGSTYTTSAITAKCTVKATFAINTYTVTPIAGAGGTINPSTAQTVKYNNTVAFTAKPAKGYSVSSFTGCGGTVAGNKLTTAPATADCTVSVAFATTTAGNNQPPSSAQFAPAATIAAVVDPVPSVAAPALDARMLALLAAVLGLVGFGVLRRSRQD